MISFDLIYLPFKHDKPQHVDDDEDNGVVIRARSAQGTRGQRLQISKKTQG